MALQVYRTAAQIEDEADLIQKIAEAQGMSFAAGLENAMEIAAFEAGTTPAAFAAARAELAADIRAGADIGAKEQARRLGVPIQHFMHITALFHYFTTGCAVADGAADASANPMAIVMVIVIEG